MTKYARRINIEGSEMGVLDAIYSRRATREFLSKPISENQVNSLIDSAIHAPSAMNRQPWAFVVIQNPDILQRISDAAKQTLMGAPEWLQHAAPGHRPVEGNDFNIFYGAKTLIVICAKIELGFAPVGDCYLAGQNLMLAALELGLATCPVGLARDILHEQHWKDELSIPEDYTATLPIVVGYAATVMPTPERVPANILSWMK